MKRKVYKEVQPLNSVSTITVYGTNRVLQLYYAVPQWKIEQKARDMEEVTPEDAEQYFNYEGTRHYLSGFMPVGKSCPEWMHEFDGYAGDSFFSGVLIKFHFGEFGDEEKVKAYTYIG